MSLIKKLDSLAKGLEENRQKDEEKKREKEREIHKWLEYYVPVFERKITETLENAKWIGLFKDKKITYVDCGEYAKDFLKRYPSKVGADKYRYPINVPEMLMEGIKKKHPEWSMKIIEAFNKNTGSYTKDRIEVTLHRP